MKILKQLIPFRGRYYIIRNFFPNKMFPERYYYIYDSEKYLSTPSHYILYLIGIEAIRQSNKKPELIVDFGCGCGYGTKLIADQLGCKVIGVDYKNDALGYARKYNSFPLVKYQKVDLRKPYGFETDIDYAFCCEVIEHIKNPLEVISKIVRSTKEFVFVTTPKEKEDCGIHSWHISPFTPTLTKELKNRFDVEELGLFKYVKPFTGNINDFIFEECKQPNNYLWLIK